MDSCRQVPRCFSAEKASVDARGIGSLKTYSRQVTERIECNVAIHLPPSVYPKAGNGALRDQWVITYSQSNSSTIIYTERDLVHRNYVTSQSKCASREYHCNLIFLKLTFLFIRDSLQLCKLPVWQSGHRAAMVTLVPYELGITVIPTWTRGNRMVRITTIQRSKQDALIAPCTWKMYCAILVISQIWLGYVMRSDSPSAPIEYSCRETQTRPSDRGKRIRK